MAAGDFRYLRLHPRCEQLLGLGREQLVLGADHIECRLVAPSRNGDRSLERNVI